MTRFQKDSSRWTSLGNATVAKYHRFVNVFLCVVVLTKVLQLYHNAKYQQHREVYGSNTGTTSIISSTNTMSPTSTDKNINNVIMTQNSSATPVSVFYNIYIPDDSEGVERAQLIIEQQLSQMNVSGIHGRSTATLYYVTIGNPLGGTNFVENLCSSYQLRCSHVKHYDKGFEMLTEQTILDYCTEEEHASHIIGYMHNKGVLNPNPDQDLVRTIMTESAMSHECINRLDKNECNVCGSNFRSVWGPTYWGNMWSARCDYVKDLISPYDVEAKNTVALKTKPEEMTMNLYGNRVERFAIGRDRYAAEQFISNHPSFIPCSYTGEYDYWSENPPLDFERHIIKTDDMKLEEMKKKDYHLREWYLLPGMLWRYYVIYNQLPPPESWMWKHYPDGKAWKNAVEKMGFPDALYHRIATETSPIITE